MCAGGCGLQLDLLRVESDPDYKAEARHRCITDHFFLSDLLGTDLDPMYESFGAVPRVYRPVLDTIYFPKNPNIPIYEQNAKHFFMHLDPRGTRKTTFGKVDLVQWILAFPAEIGMLNQSATQPLAEDICTKTASFFWKPQDAPPSRLQRLFPELVVEKKPKGTWNTPLRPPTIADFTLDFTSPQTQQSGWHPWVDNIDDICVPTNSGITATAPVRQGVIATYDTNKYALRPGGFRWFKGTRYHPFELYGKMLETIAKDPELWGVLIRAALIVKSGQKLMPGEFPPEDDVILCFPELRGMDYKSLRAEFFDGYEAFMCQKQNDPQGGHIATFDEDLYQTMLIAPERIPVLGETYICWRLPYGGKDYMNGLAEGCCARVYEGKVYVLDAWSGKYTPSRLAEKIVKEIREQQSEYLLLEELPGTEYMEGSLRNEMHRRNVSARVQWLEFQDDDNLRNERIKTLEPQARAGRVLISTACGKMGELKRQLVNFGLVRENGIVDAISRLAAKVPVSLMRQEIADEEMEGQRRVAEAAAFAFVHGYGRGEGMAEAEKQQREREIASAAAMERAMSVGLTDILGGLDG